MPTNMGRQQGFMMDPHGAGKQEYIKLLFWPLFVLNDHFYFLAPNETDNDPETGYNAKTSTYGLCRRVDGIRFSTWQLDPSTTSFEVGCLAIQPQRWNEPRWWSASCAAHYTPSQDEASVKLPRLQLGWRCRGIIRRKKSNLLQIAAFTNKVVFLKANRAMSEHNSMGSRHRRKSVPSFASNILGSGSRRSRSSPRAGSIDPLLDGSYSDGADSNGRQSSGTLHVSVSRGDLDRYSFIIIRLSY